MRITLERKESASRFFTDDEQKVIEASRVLMADELLFVGQKPFLTDSAKVSMGLEGLNPFKRHILEEFGSVWALYNMKREIEGNAKSLAYHLGIQPELVGNKIILPGQKFSAYTRALLFCCFDEEA